MAGRQAGMVSGSNAKIKLGGKTAAYAVDFQYTVDVQVIPVEVIGRVEVISHEPISMTVSGSFTIARYTKEMAKSGRNIKDSAITGNGVGALAKGAGSASGGDMSQAFNPQMVLSSSTVDIDVFQRKSGVTGADATVDYTKFMTITDCRLTRLSGSLNKRGILQESYQFVGILYSDESFTVGETTTGADLS